MEIQQQWASKYLGIKNNISCKPNFFEGSQSKQDKFFRLVRLNQHEKAYELGNSLIQSSKANAAIRKFCRYIQLNLLHKESSMSEQPRAQQSNQSQQSKEIDDSQSQDQHGDFKKIIPQKKIAQISQKIIKPRISSKFQSKSPFPQAIQNKLSTQSGKIRQNNRENSDLSTKKSNIRLKIISKLDEQKQSEKLFSKNKQNYLAQTFSYKISEDIPVLRQKNVNLINFGFNNASINQQKQANAIKSNSHNRFRISKNKIKLKL